MSVRGRERVREREGGVRERGREMEEVRERNRGGGEIDIERGRECQWE